MIVKGEAHKHLYKKLVLIPVVRDDPGKRSESTQFVGYGFSLPHFGMIRAKAFLARVCECGAKEAFEYGDRNKMKELGIKYANTAKLAAERQAHPDKEDSATAQV